MKAGIIQARMGSKRLPGKSMILLGGKPMLQNIIERVKRAKMLKKVILATTELPEDDVLLDLAEGLDIDVFRGSENDLVDRFYQCAKKFRVGTIVRICADNPLIEPEEIDRIIAGAKNKGKLWSNTHNLGGGYPDGLGAEVYSRMMINHLNQYAIGDEREHPHRYYLKLGLYGTVFCPENMEYPHLKLDVNTKEEYDFVSSIYDKFDNNEFHFLDYVESIDNAKCDLQRHGAGNI